MKQRLTFSLALAAMFLSVVAAPARHPRRSLIQREIRRSHNEAHRCAGRSHPTAWVHMYTEDARLLESGSEPLEGRARLLELARSMQPMLVGHDLRNSH